MKSSEGVAAYVVEVTGCTFAEAEKSVAEAKRRMRLTPDERKAQDIADFAKLRGLREAVMGAAS